MIYLFLSNNPSSGDINSSNLPCFIQILVEFSVSANSEDSDQTPSLSWVCTGCLCPTKKMLGLYGLKLKKLLNYNNVELLCQASR